MLNNIRRRDMSIQEFGALGEGVGSLLILITLIYLAIQSKQQRQMMKSSVNQTRWDTWASGLQQIASIPYLAELWFKAQDSPETLTPLDEMRLSISFMAVFKNFECAQYQFMLDIMTDDDATILKNALKNMLRSYPIIQQMWPVMQNECRTEFVSLVEECFKEIEFEELPA
jgi:hypothetical protein